MVAGVTYPFFVLNAIVAVELFLVLKTPLALLPSLILHAVGYAAHPYDPARSEALARSERRALLLRMSVATPSPERREPGRGEP